ncbi:MAG: hypothetical protein IJV98_03565 [Clostridia bacterium]|nr:hypothetical protein [Clostridia bacterium]
MSRQRWYPDAVVKRKDLNDLDTCVTVTLNEAPRAPYNVRVVFLHGTYVDMIAEQTSQTEELIEQARAELISAYNRGLFDMSDGHERNEDDEEEYHEELSFIETPYAEETEEEIHPDTGERRDDSFVLYYIEKDALTPEVFGLHTMDNENGDMIIELHEYTEEEYSASEPHNNVNTAKECIRLACTYDGPSDDWVYVIFSHGTFATIPLHMLREGETVEEAARDFLTCAQQQGAYDSLPLFEDENNQYGDYVAFLYQSPEMGSMNGVFNYFWEPQNYSVESQIIELRRADYREQKIVKILTAEDVKNASDSGLCPPPPARLS